MCGIAGIIGREASADAALAMSARIAHRGPDGDGLWQADGVVLAHRRLAILDPTPAGAQPMQQFECAGAGSILSVILRVPCLDSQRKCLERFDPGKHGIFGVRDDRNAIVLRDVAEDALRILGVGQYGRSVAQDVHFLFTAVLEAAEKQKFVIR